MESDSRILFVTDLWPMSTTPGEAPWASIPCLLLRERGHEVAVALLRRVFPPERLARSAIQPRHVVAEARDWIGGTLLARPCHDDLVKCLWYTSPPRATHHHRWGEWAFALTGGRLQELCRRFRPTLVHGHFAIPGGSVAQRMARRLGVPYVVSVHGADLAYTATLSPAAADAVGAVLRTADAVVANSRASAGEIERRWGIRGSHVLWQAGDLWPRIDRMSADSVRIISVGHLYRSKGYAQAADVLATAHSRGARFTWTIVGHGTLDDRRRLEQVLEVAGLTKLTTVIPHLPNEEVRRRMAEADVFLLLSQREAYGVVYAEALGTGLAVVGSRRAGAIDDFARAGAPVVAVDPEASSETVDLVSGLLLDRPSLMERKRLSADWAEQYLGWSRYVDALEAVYRRVALLRNPS